MQKDKDLPRFAGWWNHNKATRFNMRQPFDVMEGAEGWQLSQIRPYSPWQLLKLP